MLRMSTIFFDSGRQLRAFKDALGGLHIFCKRIMISWLIFDPKRDRLTVSDQFLVVLLTVL